METYLVIAYGTAVLAGLGLFVAVASQDLGTLRAESRAAHARRRRKELDLKCKVRPACQTVSRSVWHDGIDKLHEAWNMAIWL